MVRRSRVSIGTLLAIDEDLPSCINTPWLQSILEITRKSIFYHFIRSENECCKTPFGSGGLNFALSCQKESCHLGILNKIYL
jgi:hypothetical protein